MGGLVAFVVERTDAPLGPLFHSLALLSFAIPGPAHLDGVDLRAQPQHRLGQCAAEVSWFGLTEAPFSIYSMGGMIWALSSHYFPLAYLTLGPALRVLDVRLEEAALVSGARYWQVMPQDHAAAAAPRDPVDARCCCSCSACRPTRCRG